MSGILKAQRGLEALCRTGVFLAFMVLILAVLIQISGRLIGVSPVWSEELSRFALIYMTALGVGLGLMSGDLVNVDIFCDALPAPWPKRLRCLSLLATACLAAFLLPGAWKFVQIGAFQSSPALGLTMSAVHFCVFFLFALLFSFAVLHAVLILLSKQEHTHDSEI